MAWENEMSDMQISFEYYTEKKGCDLDFTKDEWGEYAVKRTRIAYKYFCIGFHCGEING